MIILDVWGEMSVDWYANGEDMDQKMKIGFRVKENALLNVLIDDYYRYWPS